MQDAQPSCENVLVGLDLLIRYESHLQGLPHLANQQWALAQEAPARGQAAQAAPYQLADDHGAIYKGIAQSAPKRA